MSRIPQYYFHCFFSQQWGLKRFRASRFSFQYFNIFQYLSRVLQYFRVFSNICREFSKILRGFPNISQYFPHVFAWFSHVVFGVSHILGGFSEMIQSMRIYNLYEACRDAAWTWRRIGSAWSWHGIGVACNLPHALKI